MPPHQQEQFEGLEWIERGLFLVPRWTVDPDVEAVKEAVKAALPSKAKEDITTTFFAHGSLNRLYNIRIGGGDDEELLLRVSLPVDPQWKTLSEVATVEWVRRKTHLPVPRILAYDASRDNPLGFEWILMSKLPGRRLADAWSSVPFPAKKEVVRELAICASTLFKEQLRGIGNIYSAESEVDNADDDLPEVKRIVSLQFFYGSVNRISHSVSRGPFRSSKDWMAARLSLEEIDCDINLAKYKEKEVREWGDESSVKELCEALKVIKRLKLLIGDFFPSSDQDAEPEPSMLFHDDLSDYNILVNEEGTLIGVVDWECVSALPLWKACSFPFFLEGPQVKSEPERAQYVPDDKGNPNELYWEDMRDYELTQLREFFLEEMRRLEPGWISMFEASQRQRDFDFATRNCSDAVSLRIINQWIASLSSETGNELSLCDLAFDEE